MARCTAPVRGHSSAAAAAACPACRYRSSSRYSSGSGGSYYPSTSSPSYTSSSSGSGRKNSKPRWSKTGSTILYTPTEVQSLTPVREAVEVQVARHPDKRDVFLCHAWDDRQGAAKELHDLLEAAGVKVWFSEKDLGLGVPMMR
ncbi:toll/interleukin-1 receptor domain-containing protein, partial [Xanthomonas citri]